MKKTTATTTADNTTTHRNTTKEHTPMKKKTATKTTEATTQTKEDTTMKTIANNTAHATTTHAETILAAIRAPVSSSAAPATSATGVAGQLQVIEETCGYGDPLSDDVRKANEGLVRRMPSSIVDRVIALAVRGKGVVAGIKLDPDAAKAALAEADEADAVATAALMLVRRAQDHSVRLRAGVTTDVSGIRTALRGFTKTKQGAALVQENDELRSLTKQHAAAAKARRTRAAAAVDTAVKAAGSTAPAAGDGAGAEPAVTVAATPVSEVSAVPKTS